MKCAICGNKTCYQGKDCTDIKEEITNHYKNDELLKRLAGAGTYLEGNFYMQLTRLEELIVFAKRMKYKKLGIAFCIGLSEEAEKIHKILSDYFDVYSACCKVCGINKEEFDFDKIIEDRFEAMCNPAGQAAVLNSEDTDLNIILGLCVGHDIVFSNGSDAPVTTLVVKDRVMAHNPLGVVYSNYYRKRIKERIASITGVSDEE